MDKSEYQKYLCSREWALLKEQVRARCHGYCERCRDGKYESTHHLTYERVGSEELEDLLAVCGNCHKFLSAKSKIDPIEERLNQSIEKVFSLMCELSPAIFDLFESAQLAGLDQVKESNPDSWLWESIKEAHIPFGRLKEALEFHVPDAEE
jgi:hypothetical protein